MALINKAAARLRQMLADPDKIVVCPGVHDGLTARMALHVGFDALYMVSISLQKLLHASLKALRPCLGNYRGHTNLHILSTYKVLADA